MTVSQMLRKLFTGDVAKSFLLKRWLPAILVVLFGSMLVSLCFFPTVYDWRFLVISELTQPKDNPVGYVFLSAGMAASGVMLIPLVGYFHRRLKVIQRRLTLLGDLFFTLGLIGFILVGALVDSPDRPRVHEVLGVVAMAGLAIAYFLYWLPMMHDRRHGKQQFDRKLMDAGTILLWIGLAGMIASLIAAEAAPSWVGLDCDGTTCWGNIPVLLSFAFWEWILFVIIAAYLFLLVQMVPENVEPIEQTRSSGA